MNNLNKASYLDDMKVELEQQGYQAQVSIDDKLGGEGVTLTARKGDDLVQFRVSEEKGRVLTSYDISIYGSDVSVVREARNANATLLDKVRLYERDKSKFHSRLSEGLADLSNNFSAYRDVSPSLEKASKDESLQAYDSKKRMVGVQVSSKGISPVVGLAVGGGAALGGVLLYDTVKNKLQSGSLSGFMADLNRKKDDVIGAVGDVGSEVAEIAAEVAVDSYLYSDSFASTSSAVSDCLPDISDCAPSGDCMPDIGDCDIGDCDLGGCDF